MYITDAVDDWHGLQATATQPGAVNHAVNGQLKAQ